MTRRIENWSRGRLQYINECPACGTGAPPKTTFNRRDNEGAMPDQWHMEQCSSCSSIWLNPRPDAESLPRAYDDYYTHETETAEGHPDGANGIIWALINGYLNHRFGLHRKPTLKIGYILFLLIEPWRLKLDYYGRHLTRQRFFRPGRLLDIGCGNGAFLRRASDMGWQTQGCEVDPKAVTACRSIGMEVLEGDAFHSDLKEQTFDVITMSHVIEHVEDQQLLLQRAYNLLRPGGWVWLSLPNPESIGLNTAKSAWHALHPPYHLCIPSQRQLRLTLEAIGFSQIKFLRRGAHTHQVWNISRRIAQREGFKVPSKSVFTFWRLLSDTMATISACQADETVILAYRSR